MNNPKLVIIVAVIAATAYVVKPVVETQFQLMACKDSTYTRQLCLYQAKYGK